MLPLLLHVPLFLPLPFLLLFVFPPVPHPFVDSLNSCYDTTSLLTVQKTHELHSCSSQFTQKGRVAMHEFDEVSWAD